MVHTYMAAYGFIANAFIAGLSFAIPRLTRKPILADALGWVVFGAWQLVLVATVVGQLAGYGQGIEWGETPIFVDPFVVVGLVLLVVNLAWPILQTREHGLYVSLWYFLAAFAWTGLVYVMGNYLPQFWFALGPHGQCGLPLIELAASRDCSAATRATAASHSAPKACRTATYVASVCLYSRAARCSASTAACTRSMSN